MSQRTRPTPMELLKARAEVSLQGQGPRRLSDGGGSQGLKRKERSEDRRTSLGGKASPPLRLVPATASRTRPSPLADDPTGGGGHRGPPGQSDQTPAAVPAVVRAPSREEGVCRGRRAAVAALADDWPRAQGRRQPPPPTTQGSGDLVEVLRRIGSELDSQHSRELAAAAGEGAQPLRGAPGKVAAPRLPWDWSLKAGVTVLSQCALPWLHRLGAEAESDGLCRAAARARRAACGSTGEARAGSEAGLRLATGAGGGEDGEDSEAQAAYAEALAYWSFTPSAPPHPRSQTCGAAESAVAAAALRAPLAAAAAGDGGAAALGELTEALRSVYFLLRTGRLPYFYLQTPQYTALWRNAAVPACDDVGHTCAPPREASAEALYAVMTPPGSGVCEQLRSNDVPFQVCHPPAPFAAAVRRPSLERAAATAGRRRDADADVEETTLEELETLNGGANSMAGSTRAPSSNATPRPTGPLIFSGHDGVHGLFDVLTACTPPGQAHAVRIHSPAPFANATCRRLRVHRAGPLLQRAVTTPDGLPDTATGAAATTSVHAVELRGIVLPGVLPALARVLRRPLGGDLKLRAGQVDRTHFLNVPATWAEQRNAVDGTSAAVDNSAVTYTEAQLVGSEWEVTTIAGAPGVRDPSVRLV